MISLAGCASPNIWSLNSISAGNELFDSSRLRYNPQRGYPHFTFEMVRLGGFIESYLSLTRFRFPPNKEVKIIFKTANQIFEEAVQVHAGGMKLKLSSESTQKIIAALQGEEKVAILMDDFEETLDPAQFSVSYAEFVGEGSMFGNILKGLVR